MATSVELRQERARTVEAMRAITTTAEAENRNLDATERESYDRGESDFRSLTERIERQEVLERADAENSREIRGGGQDRPDQTGLNSSEARSAFLTFARRGQSALNREQRALVEDQIGQVLVPDDFEAELRRDLPTLATIRPLANVRSIERNRTRRRSIGEATVAWGKLETKAEPAIEESDFTPKFDDYVYVEDLYGLAKIGEDEFDDTDVNLEAFIRDTFARAISEAEDKAFIKGTGHGDEQPLGIFAAGTGIAARTSGASDYSATSGANARGALLDDLKMLAYDVKDVYRRNGQYLMNSSTEALISVAKDGNGQYLWQPSVQAGRPNTFNGFAIATQGDIDAIAANKQIAAFGDIKAGYTILDRLGMTVQRLVELYAEDGLIGFKIRARVGGAPDRPKALHILKTKAAA
ncbi:phage major capsid protein [Pseudoclavibacter sp. RFBG4]|uniref:phage major capsid protein n=1 Tax=Pseudoclavibacter sp. RFBG4 TaxID=2080575 RepID=UPI000CE7A8A1|nr:phage major capsid protein [Pseudoclavibacter sp. RFBG4]PPG25976.1 phage major capsid protein [Pseudoclavibacter sp. RFBG4]